MERDSYEIDCLGMVEADRQYAISRLETVCAESICIIEHLDRIDIAIVKQRGHGTKGSHDQKNIRNP